MPGVESDDDDYRSDDYRPPLPPEDRVWRHPAELAAEVRSSSPLEATSTVKTSIRQAAALASIGAIGGALVVTALFLSLDGSGSGTLTAEPVTQSLALDPVMPIQHAVDEAEWASVVTAEITPSLARIEGDRKVGTGVAFQSDGMLLTSFDLVDGSDEVNVVLADGAQHRGTVIGTDELSGLAVVQIDELDLRVAPLGIFKKPAVGDYAVAVSADQGADDLEMGSLSATSGKIRVSSTRNLHGVLQLDVGIAPSGSGAALVDNTGAVIGIVVDIGTRNATHAVAIGWARKIADDIMVSGVGRHPWLGIVGIDLETGAWGLESDSGAVQVETVISNGPADRAGVRRGDQIMSLAGAPIDSMTDLILELRRHPPDQAVSLKLRRDGQELELAVRLGLRSDDSTD